MMQMKGQCFAIADMLIIKLDQRFVDSVLRNVFGIMYP
jgi:hypothetical protein